MPARPAQDHPALPLRGDRIPASPGMVRRPEALSDRSFSRDRDWPSAPSGSAAHLPLHSSAKSPSVRHPRNAETRRDGVSRNHSGCFLVNWCRKHPLLRLPGQRRSGLRPASGITARNIVLRSAEGTSLESDTGLPVSDRRCRRISLHISTQHRPDQSALSFASTGNEIQRKKLECPDSADDPLRQPPSAAGTALRHTQARASPAQRRSSDGDVFRDRDDHLHGGRDGFAFGNGTCLLRRPAVGARRRKGPRLSMSETVGCRGYRLQRPGLERRERSVP